MKTYLRTHLGAKLFLSYLAVLFVGGAVLLLAMELAIPSAFERHLAKMQEQGAAQPKGAAQGAGIRFDGRDPSILPGAPLYESFRDSFHEALALSAVAALAAALTVSFVFSRKIITSLRELTIVSRLIADGHYEERVRVPEGEADELAQLARRFNLMAERLEEAESLRQRLIGDVTHELRTPLTTIKGSMEGLIDGVLPATPEMFEQIYHEADRLARLVNDLQELSRVEAGAYPLEIRPLDLAIPVKSVLKRMSPLFEEKNIALHVDLPKTPLRVLADSDRTIQILTNLLANALHYTPSGGEVWIHAERGKDEARVLVRDTGRGIPPEHLPRLFTRFYRVDSSRSRAAGGGSGIGLTVAKHLVEAQGGRIWAESEGKGKGSAFYFTLPLA